MTTSNQRVDRAELKRAEKLGRGGDDRIAHINPLEAVILKALGGAGSTNPDTGLEEYKYGGNVSEGGKKSGASEGGGQGHNAGGRGGGSFGGGPSSVGEGLSTRERNLRDIENLAAGRPSAMAGASGRPSASGNGQSGRGGQTFSGSYSDTRDDPAAIENRARNQDAQNIGESWGDGLPGIGNELAHLFGGFLGLGEREEDFTDTAMDMARPNYNGPAAGTPDNMRANWGWDPVGALVGVGGMLGGLPAGPGLIADWASEQLGRPLDINLGRSVFETEDDPITGQTASRTHTGGGMTVHDSDDPNTFLGVSPGLGYLGEGASQAMPKRQTFTGTDPMPLDGAPASPFEPTAPNPSPIDTPPNGINVSPGNTGLNDQQLTDLFLSHMTPGRTARGRSAARVIV
jgi:hypothetical protein